MDGPTREELGAERERPRTLTRDLRATSDPARAVVAVATPSEARA